MDPLSSDGRLRIGASDEGAGAADYHFLQQIEQRECAVANAQRAACCEKILVQVADTAGGEVAAVATGDERELVVEIHQVIVDGCRGQQDDFLARAVAAAAAVGTQYAFDGAIAL